MRKPRREKPPARPQTAGSPAREPIRLDAAGLVPLAPPAGFLEDAGKLGVEFEGADLEKLGLYLAFLMRANERMNLTAVRDAGGAWGRHILDSLTLMPVLAEVPEGGRVIDVGSGGGLPGIVLAIVCPHLRFVLLEATGKKVEFLRKCVDLLGLANVEVVAGRAESVAHDRGVRTGDGREHAMREAFDVVVARAVGALNVLAELTVPFARAPGKDRPGGVVALIKGQRADAEVSHGAGALRLLNAAHEATLDTPTGRIVILVKTGVTARTYPRADGEPNRAPLGGKMPGVDEPG